MIKTKGLRHININVGDISRSLAFYQQVFGMKEMFRDGGLVFLTTPGGDDTITLSGRRERSDRRRWRIAFRMEHREQVRSR